MMSSGGLYPGVLQTVLLLNLGATLDQLEISCPLHCILACFAFASLSKVIVQLTHLSPN